MKPLHRMRIVLLFIYVICYMPVMSQQNLHSAVTALKGLEGKPEALESPFVAAGNRLYLIGFQNASFPDLGWHIDGEMGGIWDHPIKLMDGFDAQITIQGTDKSFCLDKADKFVNYPYANKHYYQWTSENISIERAQFIPDSMEGAIIQFKVINDS